MNIRNFVVICIIMVIISYLHHLIHRYYKSDNGSNISPLKHDILKQSTVDFFTIIFLYLITNKDGLNLSEFIYRILVGSFGYFIFYHILQPYIINNT